MPKKAGPLPKKESRPIRRLLREPQKRADRHDAYRCRLFGRFRDHYSYRYRGRHMPAREELLRPLLEQTRCERGSLIGECSKPHKHNYSEFLTVTLGKRKYLIRWSG